MDRVPTVVVARRPRPGAEAELHAWLARVVQAAEQAPGFVGAQVQPPDDAHPGEWLIVYRFATFDDLEAWLTSERRQTLLAEGADLVEGSAREQVVAVPSTPEPVTAVSSVRVRPGQLAAYRTHHQRVVRALEQTSGFLRAELLDPVDGQQDELVTILVFEDAPSLQRWLESPVRRELLAAMDGLVEGDRSVNVLGGWAGWFAPAGTARGPKRWKQAATVLLALFPVSLGITVLRQAFLPDLPLVPSVLVSNVVGILVLTWLLMPWLTRRLDRWLRR